MCRWWMGTLGMGLSNAFNQGLEITPVVLHWPDSICLDQQRFFEFCGANRELRIERTAQGDCEIMSPTGGETSNRNSRLNALFFNWTEQDGSGVVFDSAGGFILPNGAIRAPDVSWVKKSRLAVLTPEQKQRFLPLCPDFVLELRSPSDSLQTLQAKMLEYRANGARLGWLLDPEARRVYVYRPGRDVLVLDDPLSLAGDEVLPGFELGLEQVWVVGF